MRWVLLAAITMLATLISVPEGVARAVPFPTLYDDFRGAQIDPARWAPVFARGYEMSIGQEEGQLNLALRATGNVGSPAPPPDDPQGFINMNMTNAAAAAAIGIQVTARIEDVKTTGCPPTEPSRSFVGLQAFFFRDGPNPPNPFDFTGVVIARNQVVAFAGLPPGTLRVRFSTGRCLDFNCDTEVDLGFGGFRDVTVEQDATLGIELDAANNRIIFTKDDETQFVNNVSAHQINTNLGPLHVKRLRARHFLETCPTRPQGFIEASFQNFRIKP